MEAVRVFVSFDGDGIGQKVGRARLTDDVEEVRRVDQAINLGNECWKSFCLAHSGSIIEIAGDEGAFEIPARALAGLEAVRAQYAQAVGATVSVGVGKKLSESAKALLVAKLRGKNKTVMFDDKVAEEAARAAANPQDEQAKLRNEYLEAPKLAYESPKDVSPTNPNWMTKSAPTADPGAGSAVGRQVDRAEHSQGAEAQKEAAPAARDFEQHFRSHADGQEARDRASAVRRSSQMVQLKQQTAAALEALRGQLPVLGQIKSAYPDTYKSVMGLVQAVIGLGREVDSADKTLAKAEKAPKIWRDRGVAIPSDNHPSRGDFDTNYASAVARHFAGGDVGALKPTKVKVADVEPANAVRDEGRLRLYRRMLRSGQKVTPLVVTKTPRGWKMLDGSHRHAAAVAEGVPQLPAFELIRVKKSDSPYNPFKYDQLHGGAADAKRPEDFDPDALAIGTQHELEHTDDPELAREIAMDHLTEDPHYYDEEDDLTKAISAVPVGRPKGEEPGHANDFHEIHDYSHVLPENARKGGIVLEVHHYGDNPSYGNMHGRQVIKAVLRDQRQHNLEIGNVHASVRPSGTRVVNNLAAYKRGDTYPTTGIEPHSELDPEYRGAGLGLAMYEAAFAHAKNALGIDTVHGGIHSADAHKLHQRLAAKHGLEYQAEHNPTDTKDPYPYGHYSYTLKSELDGLDETAYIGQGKGIVFGSPPVAKEEVEPQGAFPAAGTLDKVALPTHQTAHRKLNLPVGTIHNGEVKVKHADGKSGWKGVRAGQIQGLERDAPMAGQNSHPVSSREPGSK
jgi:hypothetical protein